MKDGTSNGFVIAKPKNLPAISRSKEEDEAYLKSLPTGYRFKPNDVELVNYYLKRKVFNKPLPPNRIREVQLYNYDPETLTAMSGNKSSNGVVSEWYFFTPRDRKYRNGKRPGRGAGDGFWKATGADKHIKCKETVVGFKKTLVFYMGKPPKGDKTNWIMHEFVLKNPPVRARTGVDDMRLDDWVLCRVYKKQKDGDSKPGIPQQEEAEEDATPTHTETQKQEYGIPPPQSEQFQAQNFNMQPQQSFQMPFNNAYDVSTSVGLPFLEYSYYDPNKLEHDNTIFPQQAVTVTNYGDFIPTAAAPMSDQFHWMDHYNWNIHQQQLNFQFPAADGFLLNEDLGLPDIRDLR